MLRRIPAVIAAALLSTVVPVAAQQSCQSLATLADQALVAETGGTNPAPQMMTGLDSWTTDALSLRFDVRAAGEFLGERFRAPRSCPNRKERKDAPGRFACRYDGRTDERAYLDIDMREGEVEFISPARQFDRLGPDNSIARPQAISTAVAAATALGAPPSEIAADHATTRNRILVTVASPGAPRTVRRAEVFVLVPRQVNGFIVHGSDARVAVDVKGKPARAHLAWPDFTLGADAANVRPLTHEEIVQRIVDEVGSFSRCGWAGEITAQVGWIEGTIGQDGPNDGRFVPGIRLAVTAPEHRPLPHEPSQVHILEIPLIAATNVDS